MVLALLVALTACGGAPPEAPAPEPVTFDTTHAALGAVLDGAVTADGLVRYDLLRTRGEALDAYVATLAEVPVARLDRPDQVAFWVNAYNALTLDLIVDHPGLASIKDLDEGEVWTTRTFAVGGDRLTLDAIEHQRARPLTDGRVHAVLNCASKGCPPMPAAPLIGATVDAQLDAAAARWVAAGAVETRGDTVYLSPIFKWFPGDFARWRKQAIPGANEAQTRGLWFAAAYADPQQGSRWTAGARKVAWAEYDWSLNAAP